MKEAIYKLDDSQQSGLAKVEIIKQSGISPLGEKLFQIKVIEIIKPSFRKCKIGKTLVVAESLLSEVK